MMTGARWFPLIVALLLCAAAAPARAGDILQLARESAVRISIVISWKDETALEVSGSGWTKHCDLDAAGENFSICVATASHVLDIDALLAEAAHPNGRPSVRVEVRYADHFVYVTDRSALRIDRLHDYGEIRFPSVMPRTVLPVGDPTAVLPGAWLGSVASPPHVPFGVFTGRLVLPAPGGLTGTPEGTWLATMDITAGMSGAPVLNEAGEVVATVIGRLDWPAGGSLAILVALPQAPQLVSAADVRPTSGPFSLAPLLALLLALPATWLAALWARRPRLSAEVLRAVALICEQVAAAIEQQHGATLSGAEKKALAVQRVTELLTQLGVTVPAGLLDVAIESAVHLLQGRKGAAS